MNSARRARHLIRQLLRSRRPGIVRRHVENGRHAAERRCVCAAFEILLLRHSWFAQMNMRIDQAGQHLFAARIDEAACHGGLARRKEGRDASVENADIRRKLTACVDDHAAGDQRVEHSRLRLPYHRPASRGSSCVTTSISAACPALTLSRARSNAGRSISGSTTHSA